MSLLDTASLIVTPNGYKAGTLYSVIPNTTLGDMTVTRATSATRVNSAGLIESVASNVPRLDYSNGTCPSILVEPQRTNLALRSQELDNVAWDKSNGTMTANATVSPDGTTNAEEWIGDGSGGIHDFYQAFTGGATTTSSIYVKKNTAQFVYISLNWQDSGADWATGVYDLDNLTTATFQTGTVTSPIASIKDVGNGWRKITLSVSTANTNLYCMYGIANSLSPTFGANRGRISFTTSASFYAWGAQLEAGSYATSYIPTTSASVTRNADQVNKTSISSLIGQTEGTIFFDGILNNCEKSYVNILNGERNNNASFSIIYVKSTNSLQAFILSNGFGVGIIQAGYFLPGQRVKIAYSYKSGSSVLYLNGVQVGTSAQTFTLPSTIDDLYINDSVTYSGYQESVSNYTTALWKTKLTAVQLAQLTTI